MHLANKVFEKTVVAKEASVGHYGGNTRKLPRALDAFSEGKHENRSGSKCVSRERFTEDLVLSVHVIAVSSRGLMSP